ncbi:MAG: hypothetical protein LUQ11_09290, partial [Methylococcaceae bacterium]|nr:hypothetical protein [Methylococcaceae bacterium]
MIKDAKDMKLQTYTKTASAIGISFFFFAFYAISAHSDQSASEKINITPKEQAQRKDSNAIKPASKSAEDKLINSNHISDLNQSKKNDITDKNKQICSTNPESKPEKGDELQWWNNVIAGISAFIAFCALLVIYFQKRQFDKQLTIMEKTLNSTIRPKLAIR